MTSKTIDFLVVILRCKNNATLKPFPTNQSLDRLEGYSCKEAFGPRLPD